MYREHFYEILHANELPWPPSKQASKRSFKLFGFRFIFSFRHHVLLPLISHGPWTGSRARPLPPRDRLVGWLVGCPNGLQMICECVYRAPFSFPIPAKERTRITAVRQWLQAGKGACEQTPTVNISNCQNKALGYSSPRPGRTLGGTRHVTLDVGLFFGMGRNSLHCIIFLFSEMSSISNTDLYLKGGNEYTIFTQIVPYFHC